MRIQKLIVAVGKKAVGKTYATNNMIKEYARGIPGKVSPRKVLILDVNDEYTEYAPIAPADINKFTVQRMIEIRRIRPFKPDGQKMSLDDIVQTLSHVLDTFRGGLLLVEDINKYVTDNMPDDLIGTICTNRHANMDIMIHYQSIGRLSPKIWQNINMLRFHKNTDSVERHKNKFPDKYELLSLVERLVNKEYREHKNPRFYAYVDLEEMKIVGDYNPKHLVEAIDEFVGQNGAVVKKKMQERDSKGKLKYTEETAFLAEKKRLQEEYT